MRKMKSDGWIYLVGDYANEDVAKIGFAVSPRARLQGLQTGSASKQGMANRTFPALLESMG